MAKKYYSVRKGRNKGIYESWDACKEQVAGFKGAEFKSFLKREDAEAFLQGRTIEASDQKALVQTEAVAYVDGSYEKESCRYSCGAVLFYKDEKIEFSESDNDPELAEMRNVAGEIMGATVVMDHCLAHNIPSITIYHDYEGVAKWANGEWKTNKAGTKAYAAYCKKVREKVFVHFVKVKGHSGDRYNDEADALAKRALGLL